jgi:hypothetical protein
MKTPSSTIEWKCTFRLTEDPKRCTCESLDEHPPQRREHVGAERRQRAKLEREREHPLPHGHGREHAIDQMCGDVGHAPACAARADSARLAREGHEQIVAARVAVGAHEAVGEDTTSQIAA